MRRGFSLVEALVALALFQIAMLALAATTAVAARDLASATRRTRARAIAVNGAERMRVTACADPPGGTDEPWPRGYVEHRGLRADGSRRLIVDSVEYVLPRGRTGQVAVRASVLCP